MNSAIATAGDFAQWLSSLVILSYDALSIPEAMSVPHTTMKSIVYGLIPLFFAIASVSNVIQTATGSKDLAGLIKRLIFLIVGLQLYDFIFLKVVALCDIIAMAMGDTGRIYDFIQFVSENTARQVTDSGASGLLGWVLKTAGKVGDLASLLAPKNLILSLLNILIIIGEPILLAIRYALLCFLYVFGPLAFLLSFFQVTRKVLIAWFESLIQVSFWIVTLRILESIIVSLNVQSMAAGLKTDILPWILVMSLFIAFLILTPIVTAKVLSGENLGAVGTLAMGMVTGAIAGVTSGAGPLGKLIGRPSSVVAQKQTSGGGQLSGEGSSSVVPATGLHAIAEKTGAYAKSGIQKITGVTRRFGERIRQARKDKPRR